MRYGPEFRGTDRFQIVRCIGAGGMGVVYEAFDRDRSAMVALKTLHSLDAEALFRLKNEFHALQDLQHPNLISLGELVCESDQWFFTMELLDGRDFLEFVRPNDITPLPAERNSPAITVGARRPRLKPSPSNAETHDTLPREAAAPAGPLFDETKLRSALVQLARGLTALHRAGQVHRDVKPTNILVTEPGRLVLVDFGLATNLNALFHQSTEARVVGTVAYMAPEQAASKAVSTEADWYSVGVVLYEALTGKLPFSGESLQIMMDKQRFEPKPPSAVSSGIPADLDELCVRLLRFDPTGRPNGHEVLRALGIDERDPTSTARAPTTLSTQGPVFVGRHDELAVLREAFGRSRRGAAVTVHIEGESGVGKSAMVRHFIEALTVDEAKLVVLAGRCYERESVPYKAFDGIIDMLSRYMRKLSKADAAALLPRKAALLPQMFPVLGRVEVLAQAPHALPDILDPHELRIRVFAALRELLSLLAERNPLLIVIDDFHWADADSEMLLRELMRPPDAPNLLLVVTSRTASAESKALNVSGEITQLRLNRLSSAAAEQMVAQLLKRGDGSASDIEAIAREADGHPLFIDELVRHLLLGGEHSPGKLRLEEALWSRIGNLDDPARTLLEIVSVAGVPVEQELAARAAGLEMDAFAREVSLLRIAHLVRTTGGRGSDSVEAYHDRVRTAVMEHLGTAARIQYHERLAVVLQASGRADPETLAVHWREAGDKQKAAHYAAVAAQKAEAALAFDRAWRLYRQALSLCDGEVGEVRELRIKLGHALTNAGRGAQAAHEYVLAAVGGNAAEALDLRRRAAEQFLRSGHIDEGLAVLREVLGAVGMKLPETPRRALAMLVLGRARFRLRGPRFLKRDESHFSARERTEIDMCWAASVGLALVDPILASAFAVKTLLLALRAGDPNRVARSLAVVAAHISFERGGQRRADRLFALAESLTNEIDNPHALGLLGWLRGASSYCRGEFRQARQECEQAEHVFRERCTGVAWELDTSQLYGLMCMNYLGEFERMEDRVRLLIDEAESRGDLFAATHLRARILPYLCLAADRPERARYELESAMKLWPPRASLPHVMELLAEGSIDLYNGPGDSAYRRVEEKWAAIAKAQVHRVQFLHIHLHFLRGRGALAAAQLASDRRKLLRVADQAATQIEKEHMSWSDPVASLLHGGAAHLRGDSKEALDCLARAIDGFEKADVPVYAMAARRQKGRLLEAEGSALLAGADAWMAEQGIRNPGKMASMIAPGF